MGKRILIIGLLGVMVLSGARICDDQVQTAEQVELLEELAETVDQPETTDEVLTAYQELSAQNPDMVGWIKIPGTVINYPVMQTCNDSNYYLRRNFNKEYSALGSIFVQGNCDLEHGDNIIVYGHYTKSGSMFGSLHSYKSQDFYDAHRVINFDTLKEHREYEIIAVFKTVVNSPDGFPYYQFVEASSPSDFDEYVAECKRLSLYDTGRGATFGDRLITLSTCEYSAKNSRLVIVAKQIQERRLS